MFGPSIQHRVSEFLKTGYAVEAAQLLVASREQRYHKDLQPLVRDCIEQLMLDATAAFDGRNLIMALESAKLAEQLLSLKNEHALLLSKIEAAVEEQQSAKSWEEQRLQQAQQFQEQGRFDTAIESLGSLQNRAEAHRLHLDVVGAKRQFERYLAELRQSLDDGKLHQRVIMEKANRLSPNHPALIELKIALNESAKNSASHEYAGSSPVSSRRGGLLLDFEDPKNNTVVVFGEKTVIGEGSWARDAWSTVEVSFANGSDLGRQHAMILKHTRQGVTEFHLVIHPSSDDAERVVGIRKASGTGTARRILRNRVGENGSIDCVPLKHGDIIELGNCRDDQTVIAYRFRFHRPFAEGSTESIDAEPSSFQSDVVVPSPNTAVLSILSEAGSHEFFEESIHRNQGPIWSNAASHCAHARPVADWRQSTTLPLAGRQVAGRTNGVPLDRSLPAQSTPVNRVLDAFHTSERMYA